MDVLLAALADPARRRLVGLLAERPRPVGVLAQLAEARQPQTTKHLQHLERAGLVSSERIGQRRVYQLRPGPLRDLAAELLRLAELAEQAESHQRYLRTVRSERSAAGEPGWADGRSFRFHRSLAAPVADVWRHLTEPELLTRWWASDDLRVSEFVFEAQPGGRIVQEFRDVDDADQSDVVVGRAEGEVVEVVPGERLSYRLSPLLPDGGSAFTAHVTLSLRAADAGSELDVSYLVADSAIASADFIAGIEIGFGQSLDKLAQTLRSSS